MSETQDQFKRIVDVITCSDGGVQFCKLRALIDSLEKEDSSTSRKALEESVTRFYRLVELAQFIELSQPKSKKEDENH